MKHLLTIVLFLSVALVSFAQVSGTIVDVQKVPVIGAAVQVKGSTTGTITDLDGNFALTASGNETLVVSCLGYITQEVPLRGDTVVHIILKEETQKLDEVVVVGYGTQKKVNLTGAVGVASAKAIEARPVTTATQALQGVVPGLQIANNTGSLEKTAKINIRGTATIGEGSSGSPLVLIDGMEGDLNAINPQDIENISVLKDAAASSIYGSRAPFGVILVTTKSGKDGKTQVNYNNNFRWGAPIVKMHQMDSYTFAQYYNEAARNTANDMNAIIFTDETIQRILDYQQGKITTVLPMPESGTQWQNAFTTANANTDWYDIFYKDFNFSQEHNLSANGGNDKINYYVSLNYMKQEGLLNLGEENLQRFSGTGKVNAKLTDWLRIGYNARFIRDDYTKPSAMSDGLYDNLARQNWPNLPLYDNNGNLYSDSWPGRDFLQGGQYDKITDNLYQQVSLTFEPVKNWLVIGDFNYRLRSQDTKSYSLATYNCDIYGQPVGKDIATTSVSEQRYREDYILADLRTTYHISIDDAHNLSFLLGAQAENLWLKQYGVTAYGLISPDQPEIDLTTGLVWNSDTQQWEKKELSPYGNRSSWSTAGFFGRINYDYLGRYLVEANIRYDGTSRYRGPLRWNLYPSVSLGWNIAEEAFMEPYKRNVGTLKIRGSYGELGNQNTDGWYPTYLTFSPVVNGGAWLQNGQKTTVIGVPAAISTSLTWEKVRNWNVGLDWALFDNRFFGSFDYYTRYTLNMIGASVELPSGYTPPKTNNTDLKTYGWELEIAWQDHRSNGFEYGIKFLLSDAQTMITRYPSNTTGSIDQYLAGEKLGNIWGYETVGIARSQEEMNAHLDLLDENFYNHNGYYPSEPRMGQSALGSGWGAGDIMYADLDGDGRISAGERTMHDHGDLKILGNNTPRYQFGIDLNAAWYGVDLRIFFQGVMKRGYWQGSSYFWGANTDAWWSAALVQHLDFYRDENSLLVQRGIMEANTDAYYPRPSFDNGGGRGRNHQPQSRYLQNAAYIRLKNIQIGYTFPDKWMSKAHIQKLRLYFSAENIWTGTSLAKMFDPETIDGGSDYVAGKDWRTRNNGNAYPLSMQLSCGLSITF
mgnify:FL=1